MDLFRALDISASGLSAQRSRMDVITENLANSETSVTAAGGGPYRRKAVVLEAADGRSFPAILRRDGAAEGGVQVSRVIELPDPPRRVYEPGHPQAGPDGFVSLPNVNPLTEMVDMLATTRAYEANATAFQAAKSMGAKLLELLR
jgi:flagellar basal-body rod protein FlgC